MKEARRIRRGMALGSSVVAVVLAMASTAYACTIFSGSITITGSDTAPAGFPTAGNGSSVAWGSGKNMTYCVGGNPTGYAYAPVGSGTAKVTVAKHDCGGPKKLPEGFYDVNFLNLGAFTNYSDRNWVRDCMSTEFSADLGGSPGVRAADTYKVGSMTVDANGSGTTTVNLKAATPNKTTSPSGLVPTEEAGICVSTPAGPGTPHGMQGPITII
ncbi:MAG TPA: hypothetical protein VK988_22770 [Acidimicrobiales bacterium]|nr:hypothetical protein [Acidimicrobiales bacterium]